VELLAFESSGPSRRSPEKLVYVRTTARYQRLVPRRNGADLDIALMLISVNQLMLFWGVKPKGVLHVGAHEAEEHSAYEASAWSPVLWIEALPDKAADLETRFAQMDDQRVVSALVWDADDVPLKMKRTNNGQSSSALSLGTHLVEHPEINVIEEIGLRSSRLDTILAQSPHQFDFMNIDIQGAELRALRGLGNRIKGVKWIYCEINEKRLYVGANLVDEVDAYLSEFGFSRVDAEMTSHGWGDALYEHVDVSRRFPRLRRSLRRISSRVVASRLWKTATQRAR
jgi:FkbM family methyltransferase